MTDEPVDDDFRLAALRAELAPLRSEVESYRVQALTWRERARELERELGARRSGGAESPLARLAHRAGLGRRAGGRRPDDFDPVYYRRRYRDLAGLPDDELLRHWQQFGRPEGRRAMSSLAGVELPPLSPGDAPPLLVVTPDASDRPSSSLAADLVGELSTGYRVIVVVLRGGDPASRFAHRASTTVLLDEGVVLDEFEAGELSARLVAAYAPRAALLSTSRARDFAAPLESRGVPCVVLIQEFAQDVSPRGELANLVGTASRIVFPAVGTRDSALREHAFLRGRTLPIVRHGRVRPPAAVDAPVPRLADPDDFVVVGAGPWDPAHGVDLFLQIVAGLPDTGRPVRAIWLGRELDGELAYADLVRAHARTGTLPRRFVGVEAVDPTPYLDRADAFVLSARLEGISTTSVEAALAGVPVVTFANSCGLAEVFAEDESTSALVAPYLDVVTATQVLESWRRDPAAARAAGRAARTVASRVYDTERYARDVADLLERSVDDLGPLPDDRAAIVASGVFEPDFYWGARGTRPDDVDVLDHYLLTSRLSRPRARARAGLVGRKGARGFHPLVFAEHHPDRDERDPLAEWVRLGRPEGRWTHEVVRPAAAVSAPELPIVVHGHFFYPDALPDLLARLRRTRLTPRLVLTTDTERKADELRETLAAEGRPGEVLVVPNLGRDVGPLLTGIGFDRIADAELLLHVHGKKSAHTGGGVGDVWRDYLFGSLVAGHDGAPSAADAIVSRFAEDPTLGLVFPEDANLNDWDENREIAEALAPRLGIPLPLPVHFDFPMGGMYWARVDAIRPLFDLGLDWDDYPEEPLPVDGTVLHALERLGPFVAAAGGYRFATAAVDGLSR